MNKFHEILIGTIFIIVSVVGLIVGCENSGEQETAQTNAASEAQAVEIPAEDKTVVGKNGVIAYYFYTNTRCKSCYTIEKYTKEALESNFEDELASRKLVFTPVNVEEKENEHFLGDYQLYTKSVVLSLVKEGQEIKFKNLKKVWELLRNKDEFYKYIEEEVQKFLNEINLEKKQ